ncbi:MAG: undecaprenyldiphospho-muramoylpentapeptide beta-N-acetylglucosaminyltransferase [Clostridia bacterium]|nr:undecaprenyldiphospho-muramoylpentapeptide beta-N-acetylglucosaminyltransferase [Clostridia bacterium]
MRVLMTGGGTGGHVNPAIAIANTIRENEKDSVIAFVGTKRGIENKLVSKFGYDIHHIEIQGLRRSLSLSNIKTAYLTVTSVFKAKKLVKEFKPDVVIGTGGYVCWPVVKAAASMGIPTVLHESNALPGVAVRMLEKSVDIVYTNFEATVKKLKHPEKAIRVGNPLINGFESDAEEVSKIKNGYKKLILSYGGSLGAMRINSEMMELMKNFSSKHKDVLHIHASGAIEKQSTEEKFKEYGLDKFENLELVEYIYDMPKKMAAADLVIARAGAMTLSELAMLRKPCILIPSPNVTDNHQYKNAVELEKKGAAVVFEEKELAEGVLVNAVEKLIYDDEKLNAMKENIASFAVEDTNRLIYEGVKKLVENKKR